MRGERNRGTCEIDVWAESLIVLAVVGVKNGRTRQRLYRSLRDIDPHRIDAATASLVAAGVIQRRGCRVIQSSALEHLDRLDLICI
jgi:hypothetical protein